MHQSGVPSRPIHTGKILSLSGERGVTQLATVQIFTDQAQITFHETNVWFMKSARMLARTLNIFDSITFTLTVKSMKSAKIWRYTVCPSFSNGFQCACWNPN